MSSNNWTLAEVIAHNARVSGADKLSDDKPALRVDKESELHLKIFDEVRRRGWIALHGSMSERTHRTAGEPDFTIIASGGRKFFVECKVKNGKLSPAQRDMKHHAATLGTTIETVYSFEQFLQIIK